MHLKKKVVHFKDLNVLNMQKDFQFASNFWHWNFVSNGTYFLKCIYNPNYYASLVIFQKYINIV